MPRIFESIEINASRNRVWEIISYLDSEPKFWWGTKSVRNLSREGNLISREIYQNFGDHAIKQRIVVQPKSEIEITYLKGITEGTKDLHLDSLSEDRQRLVVEWNVHFPGVYRVTSPLIARHVRKGTKDALRRIKDVSEGRPLEQRLEQSSKTG